MAIQLVKKTNYDILESFIGDIQGTDYVNHIPELTRDNIAEVGNAIMTYQPLKETFYNAFLVKIALQLFNGFSADNKFKQFKGQQLSGDIEDAYVEYIEGMNFDPTGTDTLKLKKANVKTLYHRMDRELIYKTSVSDTQLRGAFLSEGGLNGLIQRVINTLYESKEHDEFTIIKEMIKTNLQHSGATIKIYGEDQTEKATNLLFNIKKYLQDLGFVNTLNGMSVMNRSDLSDLVIVLQKDWKLSIDLGVIANAFNMSRLELEAQIITVDNFNANEGNIVCAIIDKRGFRLHDQELNMETQRNAEGRFTNYTLYNKAMSSFAYFMPLIYFTDGESRTFEGVINEDTNTSTVAGLYDYIDEGYVHHSASVKLTTNLGLSIASKIIVTDNGNNEYAIRTVTEDSIIFTVNHLDVTTLVLFGASEVITSITLYN